MKRNFRVLLPLASLTCVGVVAVLATAAVTLYGGSGSLASAWIGDCKMTAIAVILAGLLVSGTLFAVLARRWERMLAHDLRRLPKDLRRLLRHGDDALLAGETRHDPLGLAAQRLHGMGRRLRQELSAQAEIERMAVTDALTDLPNRRGLMSSLRRVLSDRTEDQNVALLHVDLDHFKIVNDTLGHQAGDHVLQEAARRMSSVLRGSDMLARVGGDEFIIIAHGLTSVGGLEILAERVVGQFAQPIRFGEELCTIGASVGARMVREKDRSTTPERLIADADTALCDAKSAGRNRWVIFTDEMAQNILLRNQQAREIREALLDGEFRAWYQPVLDLTTHEVIGIELLSRWEHPERGMLLPETFLLPAETNNMLEEIGLQVLETACLEIKDWQSRGFDVPALHVNMTRAQLIAPGVVDKITWIMDDCNIAPDRIMLELSEQSCEGRSVEVLFANLARFSELGVGSTLDDFGSLSSSIGNVVKMQAGRIKFARALTVDIVDTKTRDATERFLCGLLGFAAPLAIDVIAKGVEDETQLQLLRDLGVTQMQGDALAAAMSGAELIKILKPALSQVPLSQKSA